MLRLEGNEQQRMRMRSPNDANQASNATSCEVEDLFQLLSPDELEAIGVSQENWQDETYRHPLAVAFQSMKELIPNRKNKEPLPKEEIMQQAINYIKKIRHDVRARLRSYEKDKKTLE